MGILKCDAVSQGLDDSLCSSNLNSKLTACERKAYAMFLTLSSEERKSIVDKIEAGIEVDRSLKLGYNAYMKLFK